MTDWRSRKRRQYSRAFKRQVLTEAAAAGVSVSSVARRHGLNANLIFNWRRRFGSVREPGFVPAVLIADPVTPPAASPIPALAPCSKMEVVCPNGRRIVVDAGFDALTLSRLLVVAEEA
ncbi:MAG: transposase [Alphaproteobacteria bacterium]|jgi:transposase|nr:transposase [Alphaproteobacteria bacterium]